MQFWKEKKNFKVAHSIKFQTRLSLVHLAELFTSNLIRFTSL